MLNLGVQISFAWFYVCGTSCLQLTKDYLNRLFTGRRY